MLTNGQTFMEILQLCTRSLLIKRWREIVDDTESGDPTRHCIIPKNKQTE